MDSALEKAHEMLKDSHDRHFHFVLDYLLGKRVDSTQLWLAVGYFLHGHGRFASIKPWRNQEQREQLLRDTDRA